MTAHRPGTSTYVHTAEHGVEEVGLAAVDHHRADARVALGHEGDGLGAVADASGLVEPAQQ